MALSEEQRKLDKNKNGRIDKDDFKMLREEPTRGTDKEFSKEVESANKKAAKKNAERIKRESGEGFAMGGMVRGYKQGGEVCRGGGCAVRGTKFRGVR